MTAKKKYYDLLPQNLPINMIYAKVLFQGDEAVDLVILEINPSVKMNKFIDVPINHKLSEVDPDASKQNPELFRVYGRVADSGKPERIEVYIKLIQSWLTVTVYSPKKGYIVALYENTTSSKQTEQFLKESEAKYRSVVENAGEAIYIVQNGTIKFANDRCFEIVKYSREELCSGNFIRFIHPDDRELVESRYLARIRGEDIPPVYSWRFIDGDGSIKWFELRVSLIQWEGQPATLNFATDITARKIAEDELRSSNRIKADIIDFLPDATVVVDREQKVLFWNKAIEEMTGLPSSEMIGKRYYIYILPFYGEAMPGLLDLVFTDSVTTSAKYPHIAHDGNSLSTEVFCPALNNGKGAWVFAKASPLHDTEGNLIGAIESIRDITASKNALEALRKSEEQYRLLAETADDIIWTTDRELHFTYISPSIKKMRGFTPEEAMRQSLSEVLTPASLQIAMHELEIRMKNIEVERFNNARLETEQYCKDGSTIWTESVIRAISESAGNITGFLGISRDITERKTADNALRESEEKFRSIFEDSNDAIFISSFEGAILDANGTMCTMFGYAKDEILKLPIINLYKNPEDRKVFQAQIQKTGALRDYEIDLLRKDSTIIYGLLNATIRRDKTGNITGYQGIFRDITDIKRLQDERQKIARLESIGTLAGGIAHDFNNILQGILGNISLAMLETRDGDRINEYLKEAEKASLNARNLTYQFLTFSKGGSPIKKKVLLGSCIRDAATLALRGSNISHTISIAPDLWPVDADEGQISQVITNIVLNAQQSMPRGGTVEVNAENIELKGQGSISRSLPVSSGNYIRIAITDHGTGIPPEHIANIFDPYFTTKQKGSGLGLATSYSITRKHNGYISVESTVGKGSTFYIYLPAVKSEIHQPRTKEEQVIEGSGTVLLMDDEDIVRQTAAKIIKKLGYDVEVAANGQEAIKMYRSSLNSGKPFDLVILDLTIPGGMGGIETIQKLLQINPSLKAIVSSGYADTSAMAEYNELGFKGMIPKPYTPTQISKVISDLMKS